MAITIRFKYGSDMVSFLNVVTEERRRKEEAERGPDIVTTGQLLTSAARDIVRVADSLTHTTKAEVFAELMVIASKLDVDVVNGRK